jgi:tRNA pseudouridine13 synthase
VLDRSDDARVKGFWKEHWGEWDRRNPYPGAERYEAVVKWLRAHPRDFRGAILRTEPRWRGLQVFAYQSWLWNEGVKQYLRDTVGIQRLVAIRYQAGTLLFPRELDAEGSRLLRDRTFPLLAPATRFADPTVERAALSVLGREDMALSDLAVPGTPEIHFEPEDRPLFVHPGRLTVAEGKRDELNRDRLRVNVAFTLPPGAYATLVVKRIFHWTLAPGRPGREPSAAAARGAPAASAPFEPAVPAPPPPAPTPEPPRGFLARRRAEKEARKTRREAARKPRPGA